MFPEAKLSSDRLKEFLDTGKDWTRLRTSITGVFVLKLPPYKSAPSRLAMELNPVNERGAPAKRRGLVLRTASELNAFNDLYQYDKLAKLMGMLDDVNPETGAVRARKDEDLIEL